MSQRQLIFRAIYSEKQKPTYHYYIEKENDWYYFKFGASRIGVNIACCDDERMSVICRRKRCYEEFKKTLFEITKQYCGVDESDSQRTAFWFFDEKTDDELEVKPIVPINLALQKYFDKALELVKKDPDGYTLKDRFKIKDTTYEVIHDKWYSKIYKKDKLTDYDANKILQSFLEYCVYQEPYNITMPLKIETHYDMMDEMIYIVEHNECPENPLSVQGWTAKELREKAGLSLLDTYGILCGLRVKPENEQERLYARFGFEYPYLFDKEQIERIRKENMEKEEMEKEIQETFNVAKMSREDKCREFLSKYTIEMIKNELSGYVLGQDELVSHAATYIYYHILRQVRKPLSPRPLLIAGPSGSGKTEVWRAAKKLYNDYLMINIVDGSSITKEGWSGNRKVSSHIMNLAEGAILIIDEFDKLAAPAHSSSGENVSYSIQSELLKLLEGEYDIKSLTGEYSDMINFDISSIGVVLVGAFEEIRNKKENENKGNIGFLNDKNVIDYSKKTDITDEDLMEYGVMPELVGRISDRCTTNKLKKEQYLQIVKNKNSKIGTLIRELENFWIDTKDVVKDEEILKLADQSEVNMLGVRWVVSQVENKLMQLLEKADLRSIFETNRKKKGATTKSHFSNNEFEFQAA